MLISEFTAQTQKAKFDCGNRDPQVYVKLSTGVIVPVLTIAMDDTYDQTELQVVISTGDPSDDTQKSKI